MVGVVLVKAVSFSRLIKGATKWRRKEGKTKLDRRAVPLMGLGLADGEEQSTSKREIQSQDHGTSKEADLGV